jgi:acyl-CoA thioester hydrolase
VRETLQVRVAFADTDAMGVVWHGNYLVWFEMGRTELLRGTGFSYRELVDRGIHLPVIEALVRYHKPARYDDLLSVRCAAHEVRGVRLRMDYEIFAGEVLRVSGHTLHAFTDERGRVVRPPRDILEKLNALATAKEARRGPEE